MSSSFRICSILKVLATFLSKQDYKQARDSESDRIFHIIKSSIINQAKSSCMQGVKIRCESKRNYMLLTVTFRKQRHINAAKRNHTLTVTGNFCKADIPSFSHMILKKPNKTLCHGLIKAFNSKQAVNNYLQILPRSRRWKASDNN